MRKHVVAVGIVVLSLGVMATALVALIFSGTGGGSAAEAAVGARSAFPAEKRERLTRRVAPAPTGHQTPHPPAPQVNTLGATRSATLVSYCWSERSAGGGGRGVCADGAPGHPAHTLPWRPGATIRIDLRLPAHDVHVQAVRITGGFGGRPSSIVTLSVNRVDRAGHIWSVRLSRRSARDNDLLIFARFANGDLLADIGVHRPSDARAQ